jgi:hypothetical protein
MQTPKHTNTLFIIVAPAKDVFLARWKGSRADGRKSGVNAAVESFVMVGSEGWFLRRLNPFPNFHGGLETIY